MPPGAEVLPAPYHHFFVLEDNGAIVLMHTPPGDDPGRQSRLITLPARIPPRRGCTLTETFMTRYPGQLPEPIILALQVLWDHQCGKLHWDCGSEDGLKADLAATIRVFGRRHGVEIEKGSLFLYATTGTLGNAPHFTYEKSEITAREDYNVVQLHFEEFCTELKRLETGLFARNQPIGCYELNNSLHRHMPYRLFLPLLPEHVLSGGEILERLSGRTA
jgi:hypothetical protein